MNIVCVGGGPAGLYFALLMKKADPSHRIRVYERNRPDDTFGFGVVFSDATLGNLAAADADTYAEITGHFAHWDAIDTHIGGRVLRSHGHGFCGLKRQVLLLILQRRCRELGVELFFDTEVDDLDAFAGADLVVAADGVGSRVRDRHAEHFGPDIDVRPNRFVWLGTTFPFEAFTFYFKESRHGLFRVHAYRYQEDGSTFIVECTEETWRRAGLDAATEDDTIAYLEKVFAGELAGHRLIKNRSIWRSFPTVTNRTWHYRNIVLVGDAAHTAHFSIGSGTKLAMEDCIDLCASLGQVAGPADLEAALARYEQARRPAVESLQRAAQVSLEWFEDTERYMRLPPEQFTMSLLTRSLRVTHEGLKKRDPAFVREDIDRWYEARARRQCGLDAGDRAAGDRGAEDPAPPMLAPCRLREVVLDNRVVGLSARLGEARDGVVGDAHLVHMGGLAVGGAGLVVTEPAAVTADGRMDAGSAGMYSQPCAQALARVVDFIHGRSRARAGVLLDHAGRRSRLGPGLAASAVAWDADRPAPRAMDRADMDRVRDAFAAAAERADRADFDVLALQLAGGSLLAGFLSPLSNRRDDDYGGPVERRLAYPLEVVRAVRAVWPERKPLAARISATDRHPGGLEPADAVRMARELAGAGCDLIEVTCGGNVAGEEPPASRLYHTRYADRVRNEAGVVTMAVDDIAGYADINSILAAGRADLCAPTRALLFDPHFVRRAAQAQGRDPGWPEAYAAARGFVPRP